jgi:RNA polymerase sigma factor (sigma-70 family)
MQGKVEICGVNTSALRLLSPVEMDTLLRRAKEGDSTARDKLIEGNLRLVLSVIQRFDKRGENPDDLFQVGCIGLIKAISNFDPDKQVRFSTYGVPMIVGCRNSERSSTMTRKQALHKAIEALKLQGENEAAEVLEQMGGDLPIMHWSDVVIRDTVDQFVVDHGRLPNAVDFKRPGMPPYRVFMEHYGLAPSDWLQATYPEHFPTKEQQMDMYTQAFIEDYWRIKPRSADEFNEKRSDKSRGWRSVARYHHLGTWRSLLAHLGLPKYYDMKQDHVPVKFKVNVILDTDFTE